MSLLDPKKVLRFFTIPGVFKISPGEKATVRHEGSGEDVTLQGTERGETEVVDPSSELFSEKE